jgi:hypothetical protein
MLNRTESFMLDPLEAQLIEYLRLTTPEHQEAMLALAAQYAKIVSARQPLSLGEQPCVVEQSRPRLVATLSEKPK